VSAGYRVGPGVLSEHPERFSYLFDPAAPVRPATPEEQALYARRCAEGGDLHDLVVLAEAPADLPGPELAPRNAEREGRAGPAEGGESA
jgi:hypothetical protein